MYSSTPSSSASAAPDARIRGRGRHTTRDLETIQAIVERYQHRPEAVLPILHDIQEQVGHIPAVAESLIAIGLQHNRAEVRALVHFYHHRRSGRGGQEADSRGPLRWDRQPLIQASADRHSGCLERA